MAFRNLPDSTWPGPITPSYVSSFFVKIASTIFLFCGGNRHRNREQSCVHIIELVMELAGAQKMIQKDPA